MRNFIFSRALNLLLSVVAGVFLVADPELNACVTALYGDFERERDFERLLRRLRSRDRLLDRDLDEDDVDEERFDVFECRRVGLLDSDRCREYLDDLSRDRLRRRCLSRDLLRRSLDRLRERLFRSRDLLRDRLRVSRDLLRDLRYLSRDRLRR